MWEKCVVHWVHWIISLHFYTKNRVTQVVTNYIDHKFWLILNYLTIEKIVGIIIPVLTSEYKFLSSFHVATFLFRV